MDGGGACWVLCGGGAGGGAAGSALKGGPRHFQHDVPPFSRMRAQAEQDAAIFTVLYKLYVGLFTLYSLNSYRYLPIAASPAALAHAKR